MAPLDSTYLKLALHIQEVNACASASIYFFSLVILILKIMDVARSWAIFLIPFVL